MSENSRNRISKNFRLSEKTCQDLQECAAKYNMSETAVVEEALNRFFTDDKNKYDIIAEKFIEKYEEKYGSYMTRIRLGVRTADMNSQIMLDVLNSMLLYKGITNDAYFSVDEMEHGIIANSRGNIKEKISRAKQRKDNK